MIKNKDNSIKSKLYIVILIILIFILFRFHLTNLRSYIDFVLIPVKSSIYKLSFRLSENIKNIFFLQEIIQENQELKIENYELVLKDIRIKELQEENRKLKELLDLQINTTHEFIIASISYRNSLEIFEFLYVDKGKVDGIEKDMVVMYRDKLLGKVKKVHKDYSEIEMITKKDFFVSVLTENGKNLGILKGNNSNEMLLENIIIDSDLELGELVVTSGISDIYPKGISVGVVDYIAENEDALFKEIMIIPEYNILDISQVLILKRGEEKIEEDNN